MSVRPFLTFAAIIAVAAPAHAAYTTVNISNYINGNITINDQLDPVGLTEGSTGLGIPFQTSGYGPNGFMGSAFLAGRASPGASSTLTIDLTGQSITGQASFYALLNNYFGQPGVDEYTVTINFVGGASESYASIGGVDTRDYNENVSNTIANTTTEWWNDGSLGQRLDVREFTIDPAHLNDQIASFQITQLQPADPAFLSGLTFSTEAAQVLVPEPGSVPLLVLGAVGIAVARRRLQFG